MVTTGWEDAAGPAAAARPFAAPPAAAVGESEAKPLAAPPAAAAAAVGESEAKPLAAPPAAAAAAAVGESDPKPEGEEANAVAAKDDRKLAGLSSPVGDTSGTVVGSVAGAVKGPGLGLSCECPPRALCAWLMNRALGEPPPPSDPAAERALAKSSLPKAWPPMPLMSDSWDRGNELRLRRGLEFCRLRGSR